MPMGSSMATAGASAREEYERRRGRDREVRRRNFPRSLLIVLVVFFAVFGLVQVGAWAANRWLISLMFEQFGASGQRELVTPKMARVLGLLLGAVTSLRMATDLWGARQTTEAWKKGYEGEVRTGQPLDGLPEAYVVLHDLRLPGTRANIDHVVIGPTGVFTVETKNYSSDVTIRRGTVRRAGRCMDPVLAQANGQAAAVRRVLGCEVRAVVCIQGAGVAVGWFSKPVVGGVRFCSGPRLREVLTRLPDVLPGKEVGRLSQAAESQLRPAGKSPTKSALRRPGDRGGTSGAVLRPVVDVASPDKGECECGGNSVLRHRRSDGAPFLGCDRFPTCRRSRPA
jgi:hypothetical protein